LHHFIGAASWLAIPLDLWLYQVCIKVIFTSVDVGEFDFIVFVLWSWVASAAAWLYKEHNRDAYNDND
jgi:hypothetical protein